MTSQGSARGRFGRAIQQGNLSGAKLAAREMRGLSLYDALDLCELIAKVRPGKYERAAIRWHGRLELEAGTLQLSESMTALAVLGGLPNDTEHAKALLTKLLRRAHPTFVPRS